MTADDEVRAAIAAATERLEAGPVVVVVTCAGCDRRFSTIQPRRGRVRRYCNPSCRGTAARARRAEKRVPGVVTPP